MDAGRSIYEVQGSAGYKKHAESLECYDYLYTRAEIKKIAERIKGAVSTPGVRKHVRCRTITLTPICRSWEQG